MAEDGGGGQGSVSWAVWQDPAVASRFTAARRGGLLGAEEQFDTLQRLVALVEATPVAVLDLGCGDGVLADAIVSVREVSRVALVDGSATMLDRARARCGLAGAY